MMDVDSAYMENGPLFEEANINLLEDKDEHGGKGFQNERKELEKSVHVSDNKELPTSVDVISEGSQIPSTKSNTEGSLSPSRKAEEEEEEPLCRDVSDTDIDGQGKILVNSIEALESTINCSEYHNEQEEPNYSMPSGKLLSGIVDDVAKNGTVLEDSDAYLNRHSKHENRTSIIPHLLGGSSLSVNTSCEKAEFYNAENVDGKINHEAMLKEDKLITEMVPSDNSTILGEGPIVLSPDNEKSSALSDLQSFNILDRSHLNIPVEKEEEMLTETNEENIATNHRSFTEMKRESLVQYAGDRGEASSQSTEKQLSPFLEKSFDNKVPASQEHQPSEKVDREATYSPKPLPEKLTVGRKRGLSQDRSPPARHKSPPGGIKQRDAHGKDYSPKKCSSHPKGRESPPRRDRSMSQSPVKRKDSSTHRRDHRGRSRSVSPYVRDHYKRDRRGRSRSVSPYARDHYRRSPRKRYSPRRRSPLSSYRSRHRSPRRPWSPPPNRNTGVGKPGRNLFVAGFSYITTERDLEKKFSRFGPVTDVRIVRDKRSGESRGFGFLSLETDEDADAAIRALDQTEWNGRIILVEKSKPSAR